MDNEERLKILEKIVFVLNDSKSDNDGRNNYPYGKDICIRTQFCSFFQGVYLLAYILQLHNE